MGTEISFVLTENQTMIRRLSGPRRNHSTVHKSTVLAVSEPNTDSPLCRKASLSVGHCSYDCCGKAVGYHKDDVRLPLSPVQLHICVTHKFHSWGPKPMKHVFVSCIHFISTELSNGEKTHIFPSRPAILVRVVSCCYTIMVCWNSVRSPCFNTYGKACC
jgi:hypothetical protein